MLALEWGKGHHSQTSVVSVESAPAVLIELGCLSSQDVSRRRVAKTKVSPELCDFQPGTALQLETGLHVSLLGVPVCSHGQLCEGALPARRTGKGVDPTFLEI